MRLNFVKIVARSAGEAGATASGLCAAILLLLYDAVTGTFESDLLDYIPSAALVDQERLNHVAGRCAAITPLLYGIVTGTRDSDLQVHIPSAALVEQERLDHASGLRAAETELERLQDMVRSLISESNTTPHMANRCRFAHHANSMSTVTCCSQCHRQQHFSPALCLPADRCCTLLMLHLHGP